ncbi:MAG: glycosyltransferase family 39 protein [bacterium]|nr:glycosyltransferase family 39 protein [bacterium]
MEKKIISLILAASFAVYAYSLHNWFCLEDFRHIANAFLIKRNFIYLLRPVGSDRITIQPFVYFMYYFNYVIFGIKSWGYHLTSILNHLINILLLFFLVKKITKDKLSAYFACLLFALSFAFSSAIFHNAQKDELASISFCLLCLLTFGKWLRVKIKRYYIYSFIFFIFGLMTHASIILFPVILFLYCFYIEQKKIELRIFIPFLVTSLGFFLLARYSSPLAASVFSPVEGGSGYSLIGIHPWRNLANYLVALYFPNVTQSISVNLDKLPFSSLLIFTVRLLLVITPCIFIMLFKFGNRIVRFSIAWIVIMLFMCLLFTSPISTYYLYFAFPCFALMVGNGLSVLKTKIKRKFLWKIVMCAFTCYLLVSIFIIQVIEKKYETKGKKSYNVLQKINQKIPFSQELKHFYFINADDFNVNFLSENIQLFRQDRIIVHISLFDTNGSINYDLHKEYRKKDPEFKNVVTNGVAAYHNSYLIRFKGDQILRIRKL